MIVLVMLALGVPLALAMLPLFIASRRARMRRMHGWLRLPRPIIIPVRQKFTDYADLNFATIVHYGISGVRDVQ